jgi:hypothetical protein
MRDRCRRKVIQQAQGNSGPADGSMATRPGRLGALSATLRAPRGLGGDGASPRQPRKHSVITVAGRPATVAS